MINHLKHWKKRLSESLSQEDIEFAFKNFEESIFVKVNITEINGDKIHKYKLEDKYRKFLKNKKEEYFKQL